MNQAQTVQFCRLLREYVMANIGAEGAHYLGYALGFRMCYGLQDDYDTDMYMRMVDLTHAAIAARYELRGL